MRAQHWDEHEKLDKKTVRKQIFSLLRIIIRDVHGGDYIINADTTLQTYFDASGIKELHRALSTLVAELGGPCHFSEHDVHRRLGRAEELVEMIWEDIISSDSNQRLEGKSKWRV